MSRPPASGHQLNPVDDASQRFLQTTPHRSPAQPRPAMHLHQRDGDATTPGSLSLPPLRQLSSTPPTPLSDRRTGNPLGVQSILNPQADLIEQQRNRRRSGSQMQTPSPIEVHPPHSLPSISRPTSVDSTDADVMPGRQFQPPGRPPARHMPSPRSPALHRTQSLGVLNHGTLNPPTGTIDAHQSPFLSASGRPMGSDPITSQPALPTPPVGPRATYFPNMPPTAPTPPPSMVRNDLRRPSMGFPQSGSASPIANFSPYSQPASVASSQFEASSGQGSYVPAPSNVHMQDSQPVPLSMDMERSRIPMAPTGQSSIQIMTIKSQQGHHVQIPVDVQAASKVADEKRKRNAGASARFRARRKEKEREASMSIARLETQLRESLEDSEFYRNERDYFKSIVFQQPGAERHYARPPSPRLRRLSAAPSIAPSSTTGGGSGSPYSAYDDDQEELERNVRRRTSSYHPATGAAPTSLNGTGPSPVSFPTPAFASINAGPTPAGMPPGRPQPQPFNPREQRPLPELQQPPAQRPVLRDPFAPSDPGRYGDRNWAPGPAPGRDY